MPLEEEEGGGGEQDMGEADHDPTCSEGTIEFKIQNFSKIANKMLSPNAVYVRDLPW